MTARQKSLSARTPKLCALYFPGDLSTGIAPVSNVTEGQLSEGEEVQCEWNGQTVTATIVKLSDYRSILTDALEDYEPDDQSDDATTAADPTTPQETSENNASTTGNEQTAAATTSNEQTATEDSSTPRTSRPAKQRKTQKKGAQDLGSGSAQRQKTLPDNIPDYAIDGELEAILQDASNNKRTTTTQTDVETITNSTQTETPYESHDDLLRLILNKVTELETKMTAMQTQLSQARPTSQVTADLVSSALSTLQDDPFDFEASETTVLQPISVTTPTSRHAYPSTPTSRPMVSTPRRQTRVNVCELGFWKLLPSEILSNDPNSVLETAKSKLPTDQIPHEVSTVKVEELKANCLNQRAQFAKNLVHHSITVGELYNRNVNGRNSTGVSKQKINPTKMNYVKEVTYKVFPCLPSEVKSSWSECVKVIDKSNVYLFNVIDKKFDISEILDYL